MQDLSTVAGGPRIGPRRRGRPRKHDAAYGDAARDSINVRNIINWAYARRGAELLGLTVRGNGPRPVAAAPPELRPVGGTTVLTEIGRSIDAIGPAGTIALAHRVAGIAEATGLDANATAKLVRRLRSEPADTTVPPTAEPDRQRETLGRLAG